MANKAVAVTRYRGAAFLAAALALLLFGGSVAAARDPARGMAWLHSVTVYRADATLGRGGATLADFLAATLPVIRKIGFNAVWLPAVWADFDPSPLVRPRVYNEQAFAAAEQALAVVQANGMKAIVGLDYVGQGFAPDLGGVKACDWAVDPRTYAAFEEYVAAFLSRLQAYRATILPLVFTEGAEGCGQATAAAGPAVAERLQQTLGSLPRRLPPRLRAQYRIGYHDYSLVTLGWGNGTGPIATPDPFDFVSMVAYNVAGTAQLDRRAARFRALYPGKPLIIGELGASGCNQEDRQAKLDAMGVGYALRHGYGFNVWGWNPGPGTAECTSPVYGGLAITNADGSPRSAARHIQALLSRRDRN